MVDTSGSMKGLRMTIAKHTVSTILDTLGENDFVNIIAVSVTSCSKTPFLSLHCNDLYLQSHDASDCRVILSSEARALKPGPIPRLNQGWTLRGP